MLMNLRNLILFVLFLHVDNAYIPCYPLQISISKRIAYTSLQLRKNKNDHNKTKIFKIDFTEDSDDPLFRPKYAFGINELQFTLIRIFVYVFTTLQILSYLLSQ